MVYAWWNYEHYINIIITGDFQIEIYLYCIYIIHVHTTSTSTFTFPFIILGYSSHLVLQN